MPMAGSILITGTGRMSGGQFKCDHCRKEINRSWIIKCALAGCERTHEICGDCLTEIQRFACADPDAARERLLAAAARAMPKPVLPIGEDGGIQLPR